MPRSTTSHVLTPNLTPLLDMVLQLITFFMMLVHFGAQLEGTAEGVRLPVAPAALPGRDLAIDRLAASIDARGRLLVNGRVLADAEATTWWANQASRRRAGLETLGGTGLATTPPSLRSGSMFPSTLAQEDLPTLVILRADRDAPYGAVRRVLSQAQERGFAQFSLVVLRREER